MSPDIRLQRWFEAPPEVVFDAYTDPDAQRDLRAGELDWIVASRPVLPPATRTSVSGAARTSSGSI